MQGTNTIASALTKEEILNDFYLAFLSRQASLLGRKEVFMGKAKFGIFGDGKELPQLAMARAFQKGDFRSGYYRDQTFMFAIGELTVQQYFAQLYAHTDIAHEPATGGRLMNGHFATRSLNEDGSWKNLTEIYNSSADISPTGGQMPRALGLAYASKIYRENEALKTATNFSKNGNEVSWSTIGNASTSEGMFFEVLNAAGVMQVPLIACVWDDNYGISVGQEYHTTKGSISEMLAGMQRSEDKKGFEIFKVNGWDYLALMEAFHKASIIARMEHTPCILHIIELTQPQGHSTSGSHERYKSADRLAWEAEWDCNTQFKKYILENGIASSDELEAIEQKANNDAKNSRDAAWNAFQTDIQADHKEAISLLQNAANFSSNAAQLNSIANELSEERTPIRSNAVRAIKRALRIVRNEPSVAQGLQVWLQKSAEESYRRFNDQLFIDSANSAFKAQAVPAKYSEDSQVLNGFEIIRNCFDLAFERDARLIAFGEDVGKIGDVNQGFSGLQEKYGETRISDTGIRECSILGQGIGAALRGLKPIAEIQYLDYLLYAIQIMSDDVACTSYRTAGGQKVPLIVRTRGHRLEGVWHSGSPMGMILGAIRGMLVLTPRNFVQAAGFYNTLLKSDDPALVIECLNGYRLKEKMPDNLADFCLPIGQVETLRNGSDITLVTYGSMCRVAMEAAALLSEVGIELEVIDAQSLLPFDLQHDIVKSLAKTNRVIFADEDVPGGATAFMMQKVLEEQGGYKFLDAEPKTIAAKEHRPAYSSDGDYFSKPSADDIFDVAYALMREAMPQSFPALY